MPLELANVPQILKMLPLKQEEQNKVLDFAKEQKIFAGEAAVKLFPDKISKELVDEKLLEQVIRKAEVAKTDLQAIAVHGKQELPEGIKWPPKPSWGNNGVNAAEEHPTIAGGVSAAANIAANMVLVLNNNTELAENPKIKAGVEASTKLALGIAVKSPLVGVGALAETAANIAANMTLLANDNPKLAKNPKIKAGVEAASKLALGIAGKLSLVGAGALAEQAKEGLREAVTQSGLQPLDQNKKPIKLEEFIDARFSEINAGVEQRLKLQKAVSTIKSLDIGIEGHDRHGDYIATSRGGQQLHDAKVGRQEMARISDTATNGYSWGPQEKKAATQKRESLKAALDMDGDGKVSAEEIHTAAKTAGVQVDEKALQQTLETGKLPRPETPAANQPTTRGTRR